MPERTGADFGVVPPSVCGTPYKRTRRREGQYAAFAAYWPHFCKKFLEPCCVFARQVSPFMRTVLKSQKAFVCTGENGKGVSPMQ